MSMACFSSAGGGDSPGERCACSRMRGGRPGSPPRCRRRTRSWRSIASTAVEPYPAGCECTGGRGLRAGPRRRQRRTTHYDGHRHHLRRRARAGIRVRRPCPASPVPAARMDGRGWRSPRSAGQPDGHNLVVFSSRARCVSHLPQLTQGCGCARKPASRASVCVATEWPIDPEMIVDLNISR